MFSLSYRHADDGDYNEPLFNEVLNITGDILCPGQS